MIKISIGDILRVRVLRFDLLIYQIFFVCSICHFTFLANAIEGKSGAASAPASAPGSSGGAADSVQMTKTVNGESVNWNGCSGNFQAVYGGGGGSSKGDDKPQAGSAAPKAEGCGDVNDMNKDLAAAFEKAIPACLSAVFGNDQQVKNIKLEHMGCKVVRNIAGSSTPSQHSYGRAIDISAMTVEFQSGPSVTVSFNENKQASPMEQQVKFRNCWKKATLGIDAEGLAKVQAQKMCGGDVGSIGMPGTEAGGKANAAHKDHLHVECKEGGEAPKSEPMVSKNLSEEQQNDI
jgi:hypothetical protein